MEGGGRQPLRGPAAKEYFPPMAITLDRRCLVARGAASLLASGPLSGCRAVDRDRPPAALLVVAGQSNAMGYGLHPRDLPRELRAHDAQVRIWTLAGFQVMSPGQNTGGHRAPEGWGPEVGFARAWRKDNPDKTLYVVKHAEGNSALGQTGMPDWDPNSRELFTMTATKIRSASVALRRAGLEPHVTAILWMQGENDAGDPAQAAAYEANLEAWLKEARRDWGEAATPVVIGQITQERAHSNLVRDAEAKVAARNPGVSVVDTASFAMQSDGLHYAGQGQARLGAEMYQAFRKAAR